MDNQVGLAVLTESTHPSAKFPRDAPHGRLNLLGVERRKVMPEIRRNVASLYRENCRIRRKLVERACGIQNLLRMGVEFRQANRQVDSRAESGSPQERNHRFHGERTKNGKPVGQHIELWTQLLVARTGKPSGRSGMIFEPKVS